MFFVFDVQLFEVKTLKTMVVDSHKECLITIGWIGLCVSVGIIICMNSFYYLCIQHQNSDLITSYRILTIIIMGFIVIH